MIFVTVGTGSKGFDTLVRKVDELAEELEERIVIQIGNGTYEPTNTEYFRFAPSLTPYFEECRVTVTAGGVGTLFELLSLYKPVVAVSNSEIPDGHQNELLERLSGEGYLYWCRNPEELHPLLEDAVPYERRCYESPPCWIDRLILEFLKTTLGTS